MKTVEEWSNAFDVLVDSYRRFKDFDKKLELDSIEFNEYEKSVFLTQALEDLIKELYNGQTLSFESGENSRRYLDSLVKTELCNSNNGVTLMNPFIHTSYSLPEDCWYIVYELGNYQSDDSCISKLTADIVPVTHDEYLRTIRNPFRGVTDKRILRLDSGDDIELISKYPILTYTIRYIAKPKPIILLDLSYDKLSIEGEYTPMTCMLHTALHQEILKKAVFTALTNRINNTNKETSK